MLAYAANAHLARHAGSPSSLVLILAGHAVLIGAVMTARMDLVGPEREKPPIVVNIPKPPVPPPEPRADPRRDPQQSFIEREIPLIDMERTIPTMPVDPGPTIEDIGAVIGIGPTIVPLDPPKAAPTRLAARFATPDSAVKPPYPLDKRRAEEEATLRLKLSIDTRGRVVAVEAIGAADPSFLEAARRHILRAWRYQPATEDGVAVPSSMVINLSFRLEDV
jgi:protein TonB